MTGSNLYIKLSNGKNIKCVADSTSAPEQGYIVEHLLLPLLAMNNAAEELALLGEHCAMDELRANATYRYIISLPTKSVHFFEERYNYDTGKFTTGDNLTNRYLDYLDSIGETTPATGQINSNEHKI